MTAADERTTAERAARRVEVRVGAMTSAAVGVLVVLLGAASGLRAAGHADEVTIWANSSLAMGLLLLALQLVASLLVHEHQVSRLDGGRRIAALMLLGPFRLAITVLVVGAVWVSRLDDDWWGWVPDHRVVEWGHTCALLLGAEAVVLCVMAGQLAIVRSSAALPPPPPGTALTPNAPESAIGAGRLAAIGASGGGIRAAAFVLGGHQAVQDRRDQLGVTLADEPHVFAVSGGSYMATALALRRKFRVDGSPRGPGRSTPWRSTYATDSAELQWLRRHTRYLFEPGSRLRDGVVTLLLGAAVNIFLVSVGLRFVVWLSTQLAVTAGVVTAERADQPDGPVTRLTMHVKDVRWQLLGFPVLCVVLVLALMLCGWWAATRFDGTDDDGGTTRRVAAALLRLSALLRPALLMLAAGWLLLLFVLPGATTGLAGAAAGNRPSARVASVLTGLGLVDEHICRQALVEDLTRAERAADRLAALNPGVQASATGGACGVEVEIKRTQAADAGPTAEGDVPDDATGLKAIQDYVDTTGRSTRARIAGVGVLLTLVAGLLRRGSTTGVVPTGRLAAVRRKLVTWLPLTIMFVLACYLALLWSSGLYTFMGSADHPSYLLVTVLLTAVASTVSFVVDANVTSLHRYYRSSLSSAFAVGVRGWGDEAKAQELPPEHVYRFSDVGDLPGDPRLHVVATLNTQQPGEAPTLRRGYPIVFSGGGVSLYRDRESAVVPMRDYEEFAGPGRVSIMATVGISGAAVSPIMGRYNESMAPYRMLLALFNLRLGTWTRNPGHTPAPGTVSRDGRGPFGFLWLTTKPGLVQMGLEAAGKSSANQRWVYLSDGGHLDNTALVECVRHTGRAGRVLVLDASNDPVDSWSATGDAIAVVKADLDVDLRQVDLGPGRRELTWARRYASGDLDVLVVKAARVEPPTPEPKDGHHDRDADGLWDDLPPNVQSFLRGHADFPRSSTARQKFGDLEFEAYRALGHVATQSALETAGWVPAASQLQAPADPDVVEEDAVVADHE